MQQDNTPDPYQVGYQHVRAKPETQGFGINAFLFAGSPSMVISEEARIQRKPAVTLASRNTTSYSRIWRNYTIFFDIGEDAKTITIEPAFYQACSSGSIFLVSVIGDQFNLWTGSVSGDQLTINSASGGSGIAITAYVTISGVPL